MSECGAPSPWGTHCTRDRDHNDHTNHLAPRWWNGLDVVADLEAEIARLTAVAEAARIFHAKGPDYWDDGHGDPEWVALGAALAALEGERRG